MWPKRIWMWLGRAIRRLLERAERPCRISALDQSKVLAPVQLICEASGGYEQALLESMAEEDIAITLVQALRVRQYARAAGILAKTDRIDARVLAAFGAALRPQPTSTTFADKSVCANWSPSVGI